MSTVPSIKLEPLTLGAAPALQQVQEERSTQPLPASDYECCICQELLLDPVVGPCGHDYCKGCLEQWRRTSCVEGSSKALVCPICRAELPQNFGVCGRLRGLLESYFPDEISARRQEAREEAADVEQRTQELLALSRCTAVQHQRASTTLHASLAPAAAPQPFTLSRGLSLMTSHGPLSGWEADAGWLNDGVAGASAYSPVLYSPHSAMTGMVGFPTGTPMRPMDVASAISQPLGFALPPVYTPTPASRAQQHQQQQQLRRSNTTGLALPPLPARRRGPSTPGYSSSEAQAASQQLSNPPSSTTQQPGAMSGGLAPRASSNGFSSWSTPDRFDPAAAFNGASATPSPAAAALLLQPPAAHPTQGHEFLLGATDEESGFGAAPAWPLPLPSHLQGSSLAAVSFLERAPEEEPGTPRHSTMFGGPLSAGIQEFLPCVAARSSAATTTAAAAPAWMAASVGPATATKHTSESDVEEQAEGSSVAGRPCADSMRRLFASNSLNLPDRAASSRPSVLLPPLPPLHPNAPELGPASMGSRRISEPGVTPRAPTPLAAVVAAASGDAWLHRGGARNSSSDREALMVDEVQPRPLSTGAIRTTGGATPGHGWLLSGEELGTEDEQDAAQVCMLHSLPIVASLSLGLPSSSSTTAEEEVQATAAVAELGETPRAPDSSGGNPFGNPFRTPRAGTGADNPFLLPAPAPRPREAVHVPASAPIYGPCATPQPAPSILQLATPLRMVRRSQSGVEPLRRHYDVPETPRACQAASPSPFTPMPPPTAEYAHPPQSVPRFNAYNEPLDLSPPVMRELRRAITDVTGMPSAEVPPTPRRHAMTNEVAHPGSGVVVQDISHLRDVVAHRAAARANPLSAVARPAAQPWHDAERDRMLRAACSSALVYVFQDRYEQQLKNGQHPPGSIFMYLKAIEEHLYHTAASRVEYSDLDSLYTRMVQAVDALTTAA